MRTKIVKHKKYWNSHTVTLTEMTSGKIICLLDALHQKRQKGDCLAEEMFIQLNRAVAVEYPEYSYPERSEPCDPKSSTQKDSSNDTGS